MSTPEMITMKEQHKEVILEIGMQAFYEALGITGKHEGDCIEVDIGSAVFDYIDRKVAALEARIEVLETYEARIKAIEIFIDDIVRPSHVNDEITPKDTTVKPLNSPIVKPYREGDEIDNTRELVLHMEERKKQRRR